MGVAGKRPGSPPPPPRSVHVVHGVYDGRFNLGGESVLAAKTFLGRRVSIPYFAEAVVNGSPVLIHHVLQDGDLLTFIRPPGFKGAGEPKEPLATAEAEGLLGAYPELLRIANAIKQEARDAGWNAEQAVDVMVARVTRWCEDHFGPLPTAVGATVNEVMNKLAQLAELTIRLTHGKAARKPGRKNSTKDIADFAESRHREMSWKDISDEWNRKHQNRQVTHQKVRDAWRRRYGDKAIPSRKLRGEG